MDELDLINHRNLVLATRTEEATLEFCQRHRLLSISKLCVCDKEMNLVKRGNIDGFTWRCSGRYCKKEVSIRKGTFFDKSKLSLSQILDLIYFWSVDSASYNNLERECNIASNNTKSDWRMFLREVCEESFLQNPAVIGGEGRTVEIDESVIPQRKDVWVFGGYDPISKEGFLISVSSRDPSIILPILKDFIRPGTTVISDCFSDENYKHLTHDHMMNFVSSVNASMTNLNYVEKWWHEVKRNKRESGLHTSMVDSYFSEFMWRQKFGKVAPFKNMIRQITQMYSV